MQEHSSTLPGAWEAFYVIIGSSAAALTGLQFVVITLLSERQPRPSEVEMKAFATPTVVHFGTVLLLSGILSAPWPGLGAPAILVGVIGVIGALSALRTLVNARKASYQPVLEDWIWHFVLPFLAYANLFVVSLLLRGRPDSMLFLVAGSAVLLLFIGIHNAWDTATYFVSNPQHRDADPSVQP